MKLVTFALLAFVALAFAADTEYTPANTESIFVENLRGSITVTQGTELKIIVSTTDAEDEAAVTVNNDNTNVQIGAPAQREESNGAAGGRSAVAGLLAVLSLFALQKQPALRLLFVVGFAAIAVWAQVDPQNVPAFLESAATVSVEVQIPAGQFIDELELRAADGLDASDSALDFSAAWLKLGVQGMIDISGFTLENNPNSTVSSTVGVMRIAHKGDSCTIDNLDITRQDLMASIIIESTATVTVTTASDTALVGSYQISTVGSSIMVRGASVLRVSAAGGDYPTESGRIGPIGGVHDIRIDSAGSVILSIGGSTTAAPEIAAVAGPAVVSLSCAPNLGAAEDAVEALFVGYEPIVPSSAIQVMAGSTDEELVVSFVGDFDSVQASREYLSPLMTQFLGSVGSVDFGGCSALSTVACGDGTTDGTEECDGEGTGPTGCCTVGCMSC